MEVFGEDGLAQKVDVIKDFKPVELKTALSVSSSHYYLDLLAVSPPSSVL